MIQPRNPINDIPNKITANNLYIYGSKYHNKDTKLIPESIVIARIISKITLLFMSLKFSSKRNIFNI